ncbi:MAG: tRNA dimethylallyltransferase, partial [Bacteroidales bacterium]|nr:tRNA dimethylallyltransferase [Bacteroidales bacterium]
RAIEVCLQTGNTYTSLRKNKPKKRDFQIIKLGLEIERNILNERINKRTDEMVKSGWLDEARTVYPYRQLNALNTVGFKELFAYFDGKMTFKDATEKIKTNTRRFAKRQMTWFKKDAGISWFNPKDKEKIISYLYDNL